MLTYSLYHFHRILFSQAGVSVLFLAAISGSLPAMKLSVNEKRRPLLKHKNTPQFYERLPALYLSQSNYCTANHSERTLKLQLNTNADLNKTLKRHWQQMHGLTFSCFYLFFNQKLDLQVTYVMYGCGSTDVNAIYEIEDGKRGYSSYNSFLTTENSMWKTQPMLRPADT